MAFAAVVEGLLDAGGVELLLVGFGEAGRGGVELREELGADGRDDGFGDGAGVLSEDGGGRGKSGSDKQIEVSDGAAPYGSMWSDQW